MKRVVIPLIGILVVLTQPVSAELTINQLFGDAMVLQRDNNIPVWGTAEPETEVTIAIADRTVTVRADARGSWRAEIEAMPAGGPHELTIVSDGQNLNFANVLVGDVWMCSGQSNMEWTVADSMNAAQEIEAAHDPEIRHFKIPRSWAEKPEALLAGGTWETTDPEHVGAFTAVGYFFARELRRHHDVPIGLINTSWGGSRIEPWMSAGSLSLDSDGVAEVLAAEKAEELGTLRAIRARIGDLPETDHGLVDGRALWAEPEFNDSGWGKTNPTLVWEEQGFEGMDGVAWYRTTFNLTAQEAATEILLGLGTIDDSDTTWVNGHEVGRTILAWNKPRIYAVQPATLKEGRNVIAVRVEDTGGGGGLYGDPNQRYVEIAGTKRPLAGPWRFQVGLVTINTDYRKNQVPTVLYNKMIHPLLPYPVAGFLWYQGESNAGHDDAVAYRTLFTTMIQEWRAGWGLGELPFLWAQLANYMTATDQPGDSDWAMLRESQSAALALPKTAQTVIIDIGDADDIHPRNKQDVGRRLAQAARRVAYGEEIVFSGPVYRSHAVRDGRVSIEFDHVGGGLVAKESAGGMLAEFAVAGSDRHFVWAEAMIEDNRVVVWSDEVQEPVAVRYAWADNPDGANLYNMEGLPASPFRTDSW